jgi:ABC-2 type transport system permease protein
MYSIFRKEWNLFFSSLMAYVSMGVFLLVVGLNVWVFQGNILESGYATLDSFFGITPWVLIFLIPAITMRSMSDEYSAGTIETLATKPVTDVQIISGKYLAALALWTFTFIPTLLYFLCIAMLDVESNGIDSGATIGSYIGLFLLGAVFTAIGLFASSLSNNQIVAFLLGVLLCYMLYDAFYRISTLPFIVGKADYWIQYLGLDAHYDAISRGVVDTRDVLYFLSVIVVFLGFTKIALERRKW